MCTGSVYYINVVSGNLNSNIYIYIFIKFIIYIYIWLSLIIVLLLRLSTVIVKYIYLGREGGREIGIERDPPK